MNVVRTQLRNILLALVVICAFVIDAGTQAPATIRAVIQAPEPGHGVVAPHDRGTAMRPRPGVLDPAQHRAGQG